MRHLSWWQILTTGIALIALVFVVRANGAVSALSSAWTEMVQRRLIVYQARGDHMIATSDPWHSGSSTYQVTTEMGVTPPAILVDADSHDLTNESVEHFNDRHRDRIARAKQLWPPD